MSLKTLLEAADEVRYSPRSLHLHTPDDLTTHLSTWARYFVHEAYGYSTSFSVIELTEAQWRHNPKLLNDFFSLELETQTEILAFLTIFVHEYTHRVDFLITPFGLQYYATGILEYWAAQEFFPEALDRADTLDHIRYLATFGEKFVSKGFPSQRLAQQWHNLEPLIHMSYAWGDGGHIQVPRKHIAVGWTETVKEPSDLLGVGIMLEPVTVLNIFHTIRLPKQSDPWYLRPMTLFETRAVVNALLFLVGLLGQRGRQNINDYYYKVYFDRAGQLPQDYFFLLDVGARLHGHDTFKSLIETGSLEQLRSTLLTLNASCWFALHAPPPTKEHHVGFSNPVLRLRVALNFLSDVARGRIAAPSDIASALLMALDVAEAQRDQPRIRSITELLPSCAQYIDELLKHNRKRTWNPEVRQHFEHVLTIMRPHFAEREISYRSRMAMPDDGNPLGGCQTASDWEITYDDYKTPPAAAEWFSMRNELFFGMTRSTPEIIHALDEHYMALLVPLFCRKCDAGMTPQWASRFAEVLELHCGYCGHVTTVNRNEMTGVHFRAPDDCADSHPAAFPGAEVREISKDSRGVAERGGQTEGVLQDGCGGPAMEQRIRDRAFFLYENDRARTAVRDLDDWLCAEDVELGVTVRAICTDLYEPT